jgi:hypothetical protein
MWNDPFTARTLNEGCASCATPSPSCYAVQFSLVPRRLVRKRHKEREQMILFCRSCYDATPDLPVLLNGTQVAIPKRGINEDELFQTQGPLCLLCQARFLPWKGLHGLIQSGLWMSGSCIESLLLASFCPQCVENLSVDLPRKL